MRTSISHLWKATLLPCIDAIQVYSEGVADYYLTLTLASLMHMVLTTYTLAHFL